MSWSADQYTKFEDERTRPVRDLVAAIPAPGPGARRMADIGCGPGNSTEVLMARFPQAAVSGIDSAPDMIRAARERLPAVSFDVADLGNWQDTGLDVILANAVLQWVPDHATLFPALVRKLAPGGTLAVQMPDNLEEPAHQLMRKVAAEGPWAGKLAAAVNARAARAPAQWYYEILRPLCQRVDVWQTTYFHPLAGGPQAIVEWFKGTGLRPFLAPLSEAEQRDYLAAYLAGIARAYPALPDGSVLLPFPRLFIVATRAG